MRAAFSLNRCAGTALRGGPSTPTSPLFAFRLYHCHSDIYLFWHAGQNTSCVTLPRTADAPAPGWRFTPLPHRASRSLPTATPTPPPVVRLFHDPDTALPPSLHTTHTTTHTHYCHSHAASWLVRLPHTALTPPYTPHLAILQPLLPHFHHHHTVFGQDVSDAAPPPLHACPISVHMLPHCRYTHLPPVHTHLFRSLHTAHTLHFHFAPIFSSYCDKQFGAGDSLCVPGHRVWDRRGAAFDGFPLPASCAHISLYASPYYNLMFELRATGRTAAFFHSHQNRRRFCRTSTSCTRVLRHLRAIFPLPHAAVTTTGHDICT